MNTNNSHQIRVDSIERAIADFKAGKPVVVMDRADRENEGDLIIAASDATKEWMAFIIRYTSGYICAPVHPDIADRLHLPHMVSRNEEALRTAYTVTIDAKERTSTGISAADRALTVRLMADPASTAGDFNRPGHVAPLRAHAGGVLARAGHTEAALDLCRLAGKPLVGVLCELVEDDGDMKRAPSCRAFADEHDLALITIEDLIAHLHELGVTPEHDDYNARVQYHSSAHLPTAAGVFTMHVYTGADNADYTALVVGDISSDEPVLTRVHSECLTGDIFGSLRCDCGPQLQAAMREVQSVGRGVIVYARGHEGRGIGLPAKIAAYALQESGADTVEANEALGLPVDDRQYGCAASILRHLGVRQVRLMTNNPDKVTALTDAGIEVVERVPSLTHVTADNVGYLTTKVQRMGHLIPDVAFGEHHVMDRGATSEQTLKGA